jgi:hypothetical protein
MRVLTHPQPPLRAILDSAVMKAGGCAVFDGFPGPGACARLLTESRLHLKGATACFVAGSDREEVRGGEPARSFITASGGTEQAALYHHPETASLVAETCNAAAHPTGGGGTYTYYARPGDHLALHRDIETCDIAVITCLFDRYRRGSSGGLTHFYPTRLQEPLSEIRSRPQNGLVSLRLPVGSTAVMFGGLLPHLITAQGPGEVRIVSILCFRMEAAV